MLHDVGMPCIPMFEDNDRALQLARNSITNWNSKHTDVRRHLVRELAGRKYASIIGISSTIQHAEFLAKTFSRD